MRVVSVIAASGAAGATTAVARIALAAGALGRRVLAVDADLGFGNLDFVLDVAPTHGLSDVLAGRCDLDEARVPAGSPCVGVVPAGLYPDPVRPLSAAERLRVLAELEAAAGGIDLLLIDSGTSPNLFFFAGLAESILLVAAPQLDARAKATTMLAALATKLPKSTLSIVVNRAETPGEGLETFTGLAAGCGAELSAELHYLGTMPFAPLLDRLGRAVNRRVLLEQPELRATAGRLTAALLSSVPTAAGARWAGLAAR